MNLLYKFCYCLCVVLTLHSVAHAAQVPPPVLSVKAYLLKDLNSQTILAASQSEQRVEPASLTKLMTAYLAFEALQNGQIKLSDQLKISDQAFSAEGSRMFIEPRKPVSIEALLFGLIVQSGNDAAIALAEQLGVTEQGFALLMNEKAKQLGMRNTHYMNATGLPDPEHYTTASDLMQLSEALIRDFPQDFKTYYATKNYTYNNIKQDNRNRLLWLDEHVDGLKTGHTKSAGYCLIATASREGVRHIAITLGAKSKADRTSETQKLLNYGFQFFDTVALYKKNEKIKSKDQTLKVLNVWKGAQKTLHVTVAQDLIVTVPKNMVKTLSATITTSEPLIAPISKGQEIGEVKVILEGKELISTPLVAASAVGKAGFFTQLWDSIRLFFADWMGD